MLVVEELEVRDEEELRRGEPGGELEDVVIEPELNRTVKIGASATQQLKDGLKEFLTRNSDIFAWSHEDMPGIDTKIVAHHLNINPEARPVKQKRRVFAAERNEAINEEVQKLLKARFIREVHYPTWISNVVMVKKANGKWRMCVDFSDLNKACPKDSFPLPTIDLLVNSTAGHQVLSFMDAFSGYNQIRMAEHDKEHTAFITDRGLYCYEVMPFGLKNAGATYQRLMNSMFDQQIGRNVEVYVDDMLVKSKRVADHIADLEETFSTLRRFRMKLNPAKCAFGVASGKFLGFMVSNRGIEANPEKVRAILDMRSPRATKEVQSLAGRIAALNRFISRSSDKCLPFFKTLRRAFEWTEECEVAFQQMKCYLGAVPLLSKTEPGETLYLYLAVSATAVSAALVREEGGSQKPVYYTSRALRGAEGRYPKMELLAFALVNAARRLRAYFQAHAIVVLTDQPLKNILHKPETSGRLVKWAIELSQYDIRYQPRTSIKGQAMADFIAEFTTGDPSEGENTVDQTWVLNVDGSSNKGGSGAGIVLVSPDGFKAEYALRFNFAATNNEAEYEALLAGLRLARTMGADHVIVRSDSQLVVEQVEGEYEAKDNNMAEYRRIAQELIGKFSKLTLEKVPRESNEEADRLARIASSKEQEPGVPTEVLESPSIQSTEVLQIEVEAEWAKSIRDYLENGTLPDDPNEQKRIKYRAPKYVLINGVLYRRGHTMPLLRCANEAEADYILREVHEGVCGNHSGWRMLAKKVLRSAFYWPTLERDAQALVRKCDKCQRYANVPRAPPHELIPIQSPWPFAQWGIDIVGPLPTGKGQRKFAVVAIDYFTKWAEAEALASITEQNMRKFLWQGIVCRFGIPRVVITDNGKQFEGKIFNELCEQLQIEHRYSSPEHPQANGQVEVTNRSLLKILKTRLEKAKGLWADELPSILWAYRTTERTPTGYTPFCLAFGTEAMIPVEIGIPSPRVELFSPDNNEESMKTELDLIEERRLQAAIRLAAHQQRMKQHHDKRVKPRSFKAGDLVLKRVNQTTRDPKDGKLGPNWEGPYVITSITRKGAYWLKDYSGKSLPHPWNGEHLKFYFA